MAICGLNLSLDAIQGDITAKISGIIDLNSTLTSVSALTDYKATLDAGMSSIKSKVSDLIPDIPISTSGFTSLRDTISSYASSPTAAGLASLTSQFGGLTSLSGYANINLSDLASSALSIGASFDPCSAVSGIPNVVADASGALQSLADQAPNIGGTVMALKDSLPEQLLPDVAALAAANNTHILTSTSIADAKKLFETNIVPSIDQAIKKFPNGKEVVTTVDEMVEELKAESHVLEDENDEVFNHKTGKIETNPERKELLKKMYAKQATQEERLRKY
ncbi:uncharacterized protein METZ01_LOCUS194353, partial [marine metagenome]